MMRIVALKHGGERTVDKLVRCGVHSYVEDSQLAASKHTPGE